jgi:hypothetical protein
MNSKQNSNSGKRSTERGSVLAISAFGMLAFLLAVGLSLDVSHFYVVRAELQNAADSAALAGASALNSSPAGITLAQDRAVEVMNNFEFNNTGVTINPSDVKFAVNYDGPYVSAGDAQAQSKDIRFVQVDVPPKTVGVGLASISLGTNNVQMGQRAIAGMSMPPNVICEWIPLSVIDDDTAGPGTGTKFIPGQTYVIRAGPQNSVSPGNYQILAVAGRGGNEVRYGIGKGVNDCAEPGSVYTKDTKPGETAGAVRQGLNTRFDDYAAGLSPDEYPPDVNIKQGISWADYKLSLNPATRSGANFEPATESHHPVAMRRVVLIPLIKWSEYDQGRDTVKFEKFAAFFLRTKVGQGNGGDFEAEYIEDRFVFGKGGYRPGGGPVVPELTQPVLYK